MYNSIATSFNKKRLLTFFIHYLQSYKTYSKALYLYRAFKGFNPNYDKTLKNSIISSVLTSWNKTYFVVES